MKYPLWIVNSSLALLLIAMIIFILLSRQSIPARQEIEPDIPRTVPTQRISAVNIAKIYENDLFDTYRKEEAIEERPQFLEVPIPPSPTPEYRHVPQLPKLVFLEPLDVSLKGLVVLAQDDTKNRAIIQNKKTLREDVFKVGDTIEDAQLIRIFSNKIIFIRSNGQQEVLYLREKDAKKDPAYAVIVGWNDVVRKIHDTQYEVSPKEFRQRVMNLAQFLDLVDVTTAYKRGVSIGCRIGKQTPYSLGTALGLQDGDIINKINDIPATTTDNRFAIYQLVTALPLNQSVFVALTRNGAPITIEYQLKDFRPRIDQSERVAEKQRADKIKILQQQQRVFAPTLKELRLQEQQNMLQQGKLQNQSQNMKTHEQTHE